MVLNKKGYITEYNANVIEDILELMDDDDLDWGWWKPYHHRRRRVFQPPVKPPVKPPFEPPFDPWRIGDVGLTKDGHYFMFTHYKLYDNDQYYKVRHTYPDSTHKDGFRTDVHSPDRNFRLPKSDFDNSIVSRVRRTLYGSMIFKVGNIIKDADDNYWQIIYKKEEDEWSSGVPVNIIQVKMKDDTSYQSRSNNQWELVKTPEGDYITLTDVLIESRYQKTPPNNYEYFDIPTDLAVDPVVDPVVEDQDPDPVVEDPDPVIVRSEPVIGEDEDGNERSTVITTVDGVETEREITTNNKDGLQQSVEIIDSLTGEQRDIYFNVKGYPSDNWKKIKMGDIFLRLSRHDHPVIQKITEFNIRDIENLPHAPNISSIVIEPESHQYVNVNPRNIKNYISDPNSQEWKDALYEMNDFQLDWLSENKPEYDTRDDPVEDPDPVVQDDPYVPPTLETLKVGDPVIFGDQIYAFEYFLSEHALTLGSSESERITIFNKDVSKIGIRVTDQAGFSYIQILSLSGSSILTGQPARAKF